MSSSRSIESITVSTNVVSTVKTPKVSMSEVLIFTWANSSIDPENDVNLPLTVKSWFSLDDNAPEQPGISNELFWTSNVTIQYDWLPNWSVTYILRMFSPTSAQVNVWELSVTSGENENCRLPFAQVFVLPILKSPAQISIFPSSRIPSPFVSTPQSVVAILDIQDGSGADVSSTTIVW